MKDINTVINQTVIDLSLALILSYRSCFFTDVIMTYMCLVPHILPGVSSIVSRFFLKDAPIVSVCIYVKKNIVEMSHTYMKIH